MTDDFISVVITEAERAVAEYDALVLDLHEKRNSLHKVRREIVLLNALLEYHGKEGVDIDKLDEGRINANR